MVVVAGGAIVSDGLITTRLALEQWREVFAITGTINSRVAEGTNYLSKQGAKLVTDTEDILVELGYDNKSNKGNKEIPKGETEEEQKYNRSANKRAVGF